GLDLRPPPPDHGRRLPRADGPHRRRPARRSPELRPGPASAGPAHRAHRPRLDCRRPVGARRPGPVGAHRRHRDRPHSTRSLTPRRASSPPSRAHRSAGTHPGGNAMTRISRRPVSRRTATTGIAAAAVVGLAACTAPGEGGGSSESAPAEDVPESPSEAVTLNIFDVAGGQKELGPMIEKWAEDNPEIISSVSFESGDAPSLVGQIKPQVDSGRLEVDMVLTGNDGLSAGIGSDLWVPLIESYGDRLGNQDNYLEPAAAMQELASGYGAVVSYYPSGPLLQYNPEKVDEVPTTPEELLAWAEEHPGKFGYARPANSGPGRTFLMGLPYILGDSDPKDPENGLEKTWAYLKDIGQYI